MEHAFADGYLTMYLWDTGVPIAVISEAWALTGLVFVAIGIWALIENLIIPLIRKVINWWRKRHPLTT